MRWRALYLHSPLGLAPIGTRGLRHRECPSQSPSYSLGAARPGGRGEDAVNRLMICSVPPRCAVPTVEEGEGGRKGQRAFASNFNSAAWLQLGSHRAGPHEARALSWLGGMSHLQRQCNALKTWEDTLRGCVTREPLPLQNWWASVTHQLHAPPLGPPRHTFRSRVPREGTRSDPGWAHALITSYYRPTSDEALLAPPPAIVPESPSAL